MSHPQTFAQKLSEERRSALLSTLATMPGYRANERLLHDVVSDAGLPCSRDQVRSDMAWLRDQGLITLQDLAGVYVAQITQPGMDVASDRVKVPGVAPTGPR